MHCCVVQQGHLYCKFDLALCERTSDAKEAACPDRYDVLAFIWNQTTDFTYRLSAVNITVNGEHPDANYSPRCSSQDLAPFLRIAGGRLSSSLVTRRLPRHVEAQAITSPPTSGRRGSTFATLTTTRGWSSFSG